jgi:hypothetical protein
MQRYKLIIIFIHCALYIIPYFCGIKKVLHILFIAGAVLVLVILLVYLLLWLPPVQQKIKDIVLKELMKTTHNRMSIGELRFRPFNSLSARDIYVEDLKGDTLLFAGELLADFDLFRLRNNQLFVRSVDLENFVVNLRKDSFPADFNFQFLIDSFDSGRQDTASSKLTVQIQDIHLKDGRFHYDILSEPALEDSLFDFNHISISRLQSDIDLNFKDIKNLEVHIYQLSFMEKSGLNVNRLEVKLCSMEDKMTLENGLLQLPHSELTINAEILETKELKINLGENRVNPADFKMFYPGLSYFSENLILAGEINGILPQINVSRFQADYGNRIHLKFLGSIGDFYKWKETPVRLKLDRLAVDAHSVEKITRLIYKDKQKEFPVDLGAVSLSGTLEGSLPDLLLHLTAQCDRGTVFMDGQGGYDFDSGISHFDAAFNTSQLDVKTLLRDSLFGLAGLQLQAKGTVAPSGNLSAEGNVRIDRFDFNGYSFNRIQAAGAYQGDNIRLNLNSEDNNVDLQLNLSANTGKKTPGVKLEANVNCIYLDVLNVLSDDYKNAFLNTRITAGVKGFNPEKMNVDFSVDSFSLYTNKGAFHEPHLHLAYQAADSSRKQLDISSRIVSARARGHFTYTGILESLKETFPMLFPDSKRYPKKKDKFAQDLNFRIGMNDINSLSDILELPRSIPDSILFIGKYNNDGKNLNLSTSAYTLFAESDTLQLSLSLFNKENNLAAIFNVDNKSSGYDVDGSIDAEIEFVPQKGNLVPDMNIALNPTVFVLNETDFNLNPAQIEIKNGRYIIHNLSFDYANSSNEYIKADGVISASREDSLNVDISQFQMSTLFGTMKADIPLSGVANGQITARNLLSTPFILSRGFTINDIILANNAIGDLKITSAWSSERNGLALRATLSHDDHPQSVVSGFILPEKDSLSVTATIRDMELQWLQEMMKGTLFGLSGTFNANLKADGKIKNPVVNGTVYFNDAQIGVNQLNTLYSISDSIYLSPDLIELKRFTILDENRHPLVVTGKINHQKFTGFNPNLSISLSDFLVINNEHQTDSLFYGNLRINGLLNVKKNNKDWLLTGDITHSDNSKLTVNIPFSASTAERYNSITFINSEGEDLDVVTKRKKKEEKFTLPFKINVSLWLDPSLTAGAVFNPLTKDAALVTGNGSIKLSYDMNTSSISLLGDYEVESGNATLSLVNITKKTFAVERGGRLIFRGDPMATTFDVTALYNLRADLTILDPGFERLGLSSTKVPVACSLTATGSLNKMELKYNLLLPNESEDIQRRMDGLLFSDDIKIREIAYLLAFGTFLPVNSSSLTGNSALWTALASSSITNHLNNLLSPVLLKGNWSVGTNLRTKDSGFEEMDMDVNVSTHLFNDRLTVNGTVGYHNDPNQKNNFTGDFDVEYKLIPSGNMLLKFYNVTNNQYFESSKTTQGVGVVYKREARTFKKLFDKFGKKSNK